MNVLFIKEKKRQLGLSNEDIAKRTGLTLSTLDKITSGTNDNPTLGTLEKLADLFDCKLDDFRDNPRTTDALPADERELLGYYRLLPEPVKTDVRAYALFRAGGESRK